MTSTGREGTQMVTKVFNERRSDSGIDRNHQKERILGDKSDAQTLKLLVFLKSEQGEMLKSSSGE
jgi:hypothetical protein